MILLVRIKPGKRTAQSCSLQRFVYYLRKCSAYAAQGHRRGAVVADISHALLAYGALARSQRIHDDARLTMAARGDGGLEYRWSAGRPDAGGAMVNEQFAVRFDLHSTACPISVLAPLVLIDQTLAEAPPTNAPAANDQVAASVVEMALMR